VHIEPAGGCHNPIKLSGGLRFSADGGIDSVIVEDTFWWFELYNRHGKCEKIGNTPDYCSDNYCKRGNTTMKIECSWFSVAQTDEHTLLVSVNENETDEEKVQGINVQSGNCFSSFSITQYSKTPRELWFSAKGGKDSITTEGEWYYITERITIGDTIITLLDKEYCSEIYPFIEDGKVYMCTDEIPFFVSEDYYSRGIVGIEYPWFTVDKPDNKKVIFSVSENITGKNRKFSISLDAGDYFTNIWVNQSAE
jgi:hypothetical protein